MTLALSLISLMLSLCYLRTSALGRTPGHLPGQDLDLKLLYGVAVRSLGSTESSALTNRASVNESLCLSKPQLPCVLG